MDIKCVHSTVLLTDLCSHSEKERDESQVRLCVSPQTSPGHSEMEARRDRREPHHKSQRSPKNRLPHRGPNGGDPGGGVRDELADALVMSEDHSRSNGSVRSSFSRTWQRFKVIVNWPYLDLQYFLIDFGYDANLHIRIMKGMIRAFV